MSDGSIAEPVPVSMPKRGKSRSRDRFFLWMALTMLALNLVGFAPSYFLGTVFDAPALPLRTHLHGAIFTSWFVLFAIQSTLIVQRNVTLHRRLGAAGAVLMALMVASGLVILRFRALEYAGTEESLSSTTTVVWGNLALLSLFSTFSGLGIAFRRRPQVHKRLMLLACLSMMGQSLGRLGRFPGLRLGDTFVLNEVVWGLGGLVALITAMAIHDLVTMRRIHRATLLGGPAIPVTVILAAVVLPSAEFARGLILWLN